MKSLMRILIMAIALVVTTSWISGCVVHTHSTTTRAKPAKKRRAKPAKKASPVKEANPETNDESESEHNPPEPPPPPTY